VNRDSLLVVKRPPCYIDHINGQSNRAAAQQPQLRSAFENAIRVLSLRAGATQLKLFPAITHGPRHLQALRAVLPAGVRVFPVGGVGAAEIPASAGAAGFGSELFHVLEEGILWDSRRQVLWWTAGDVFLYRVGVRGLPEPQYQP